MCFYYIKILHLKSSLSVVPFTLVMWYGMLLCRMRDLLLSDAALFTSTGRTDGAAGGVCGWTVEGRALWAYIWHLQADYTHLREAPWLWGTTLQSMTSYWHGGNISACPGCDPWPESGEMRVFQRHKYSNMLSNLVIRQQTIAISWCSFSLCCSETGPPVRHTASCLQQGDWGHAHGQEVAGHLLQSGFLWPGRYLEGVEKYFVLAFDLCWLEFHRPSVQLKFGKWVINIFSQEIPSLVCTFFSY